MQVGVGLYYQKLLTQIFSDILKYLNFSVWVLFVYWVLVTVDLDTQYMFHPFNICVILILCVGEVLLI